MASCLLLLFSSAVTLSGQTLGNRKAVSVDVRHFTQSFSNDAAGNVGIDLINLSTLVTRPFGTSTWGANVGRGLLLLFASTVVGQAHALSFHEHGHGTRLAAIGYKPRYGFGTVNSIDETTDGGRKVYGSFFAYLGNSLFKNSGYAFGVVDSAFATPLPQSQVELMRWSILLTAGGLNNDMIMAEKIEDEMHRQEGHIGFFSAYVNAKLAASQYTLSGPLGDVTNTVGYYQFAGLDIRERDIDAGSRVSFFLSALSYQLVYQTIRMFTGKTFRFDPWRPYGIELPNVSFFMTTRGLSYKIRSGIRRGHWRFPVAFETVYKGDATSEITFGIERQTNDLKLRVHTTIGRSLEPGVSLGYRLRDRLIVAAGYSLFNSRNLHGERYIPTVLNGNAYHDLSLRGSFVY